DWSSDVCSSDLVEAPRVAGAHLVADDVGRGGELHVGGHRAADQQVDLHGIDAPLGTQALDGLDGHHAHALVLALEDAALLDAGALGDPGVVGVHHGLQQLVGEPELGHVALHGGDGSGDLAHFNASWMRSLRRLSTRSRAARTMLRIAASLLMPWPMITLPFTPSTGNPP